MGETVNIYNALFSTWQQPIDPDFSQRFSKHLGYMYADLERRPLEEKWVHPASAPQCLSRKHSGYRVSADHGQPEPNPGVMPLPGVDCEKTNHTNSYKLAFLLVLLLKLAPKYTYLP